MNHKRSSSDLQRVGPPAEKQDAEAAGEGEASGGSMRGDAPNETWAMDFVHDQLATGRKLRVLTVVDTLSRYVAGGRSAVQLSGRGRGRDARAGLRRSRLSRRRSASTRAPSSSPATSTSGPTCDGVTLDFSPTGKADGQCVSSRPSTASFRHGMPEHPLVPDACGRPRKDGGLAQILQSRITTPICLYH